MGEINIELKRVILIKLRLFKEAMNLYIHSKEVDFDVLLIKYGSKFDHFITDEYGVCSRDINGKILYVIDDGEAYLGYVSSGGKVFLPEIPFEEDYINKKYGITPNELERIVIDKFNEKKLMLKK